MLPRSTIWAVTLTLQPPPQKPHTVRRSQNRCTVVFYFSLASRAQSRDLIPVPDLLLQLPHNQRVPWVEFRKGRSPHTFSSEHSTSPSSSKLVSIYLTIPQLCCMVCTPLCLRCHQAAFHPSKRAPSRPNSLLPSHLLANLP